MRLALRSDGGRPPPSFSPPLLQQSPLPRSHFPPLGTFGGAKDSLPDGRDRNAGTGAPWDDAGSVLRQYGEDTKLDLKNSSSQQRISDSDLPTGGFSLSLSARPAS